MRPDLTAERVVAATLVLMDPAVHLTLVREHGWTRPEYANWIQAHDHGRAPQGYLEGGMTGGVLTIGRLIVTAPRAARQAVPEAEGLSGTRPASATAEPRIAGQLPLARSGSETLQLRQAYALVDRLYHGNTRLAELITKFLTG